MNESIYQVADWTGKILANHMTLDMSFIFLKGLIEAEEKKDNPVIDFRLIKMTHF